MVGYSGTPLPKKLGIREGSRVGAVDAPDHLDDLLVPWPQDAIVGSLDPASTATSDGARFDVILLFVKDERALTQGLETAPDHLKIEGGLWIGWPKMKSPLFDGLKESHVRDAGLKTGMVDNKICAIDADWSGLRFVFRKEDRPEITARRNAREEQR